MLTAEALSLAPTGRRGAGSLVLESWVSGGSRDRRGSPRTQAFQLFDPHVRRVALSILTCPPDALPHPPTRRRRSRPRVQRATDGQVLPGVEPLTLPLLLPRSDRPALLEEREAVRGRVQQRAPAPLLPDPVQRGQRGSLLGPGRPLGHHQLQGVQVGAAGRAEDR